MNLPVTPSECKARGICAANPTWACGSARHPHYCTIAARELAAREFDPAAPTPYRDALRKESAGRLVDWGQTPAGVIRVGVLAGTLGFGGFERWLSHILAAVPPDARRMVVVGLACSDPNPPDPAVVAAYGLARLRIASGTDAVASLAHSVDLLVAWTPTALDALEPIEALPSRVVFVAHGGPSFSGHAMRRAAAGVALAAVSSAAVAAFPESERHRVAVIPNAIDVGQEVLPAEWARRRAEARAAWEVPEGGRVLGWLARVSAEKRPDRWLDALAALPPEWSGVMIGPGAASLDRAIRDRGLDDRVRRLGPVAHPEAILPGLDCLLMPSDEEGFGYAAVEAIEALVPVVMTPTGFAADFPDLVETVGFEASALETAARVIHAPAAGGGAADDRRRLARLRFSVGAFRRAWGQLLRDAAKAPRPEPTGEVLRPSGIVVGRPTDQPDWRLVQRRIRDCPSRGAQTKASCGCGMVNLCAEGKGEPAGEVRSEHCRDCVLERLAAEKSARRARPPIRVGILSPGCFTGGAEMWMLALLSHLDCTRAVASRVAIAYGDAVDRVLFEALDRLAPVGVGARAIDRLWEESDVVLAWGVPRRDRRTPDRPRAARCVLVSHGIGPWTAGVLYPGDDADGRVAVSAAAIAPYPEPDRASAVVIGNGVDLARLEPAADARDRVRRELSVPHDRRLVLYQGRIADEKNPRAFVDLAAEAEARWPGRFAFAVAGVGAGLEPERARAAEVAPHVRWLGARRDVADLLAAADHLVLPSHEEADSMTLLEAFACGVPVVATRVGRLSEPEYAALARVVERNPTPAELCDALDRDAIDPDVAGRVRAARGLIRARHTADTMATRWMDYLETLTGQDS